MLMLSISWAILLSAAWDLFRWKRYVSWSEEIWGLGPDGRPRAARYCEISVAARVAISVFLCFVHVLLL